MTIHTHSICLNKAAEWLTDLLCDWKMEFDEIVLGRGLKVFYVVVSRFVGFLKLNNVAPSSIPTSAVKQQHQCNNKEIIISVW